MNIQSLAYFIQVADSKSYSIAAKKIYVAQSSLSTSVKKLEDELGIKLFNYDGKSLHLTIEGERFYELAQEFLTSYEVFFESAKKITDDGGDASRGTLSFINCADGKSYFMDADGNYWRCYNFVDNAVTYQVLESGKMFYNVGEAFGHFQKYLADYPADTLHETIPMFHDTKNRLKNLKEAVAKDVCGRLKEVEPELEEIMKRESAAGELLDMLDAGILPLKVTHNDTKVNNVLIDNDTKLGICVIDLDTVMPGLAAYDFGDAIRVGACTAEEDEKDLSKVNFDINMYSCFANGFIDGTSGLLSRAEIESLPAGAKIMTLENAIRFLTDYLSGDTYFKIHRPEHNLDRCRTQLRMVKHFEDNYSEMMRIVREAGKII